jgi:NADPH:quinone reductase-like Zn-dependent oxidoreductase
VKVVEITKKGDPSVLKIKEVADPSLKPNQLKVKVKASGINFADILARQGLYQDAPPLPCVVGYEVSGIVSEVGKELSPSWLGKEIICITRFNGYADTVYVSPMQVFEKPKSFTFSQAAAIPVNYLTSYGLLVVMGSLKKGETVLIQNAGGGIGLSALQIAKHLGAKTIGTASPSKHERLKAMGLDHPVDYRKSDWEKEILRLTDKKGVDLIIDPLGPTSWKKSLKLLRHCGRLGIFGASEMSSNSPFNILGSLKTLISMPWIHPLGLLNNNRGIFGLNLGHMWHESERMQKWGQEILQGERDGWVKPHVDREFKLEEAAEAHQYIEDRKNFGKVILLP